MVTASIFLSDATSTGRFGRDQTKLNRRDFVDLRVFVRRKDPVKEPLMSLRRPFDNRFTTQGSNTCISEGTISSGFATRGKGRERGEHGLKNRFVGLLSLGRRVRHRVDCSL